jgi:hypothetical protein
MLDGGRYCDCTLDIQRLENMTRIWKGLKEAQGIAGLRKNPPLNTLVTRNLWITADEGTLRAHLKAVAFNKAILWDARVYSDKDLLSAWLKTARAQGHKIYDTEIDEDVGFAAMDIDELVEPPELVILVLGVKHAPNKEAPNCLLEALAARRHIGRPTWIIDQLDHPLNDMAHRCYSEHLEGLLSHWTHLGLAGRQVKILGGPPRPVDPVAETKADDILEDGEAEEVGEEIDEALADLGDEEEVEEDEDEEEDAPAGMLGDLANNEETQEKKSRKKRFSKKKPFGGKR